MKVAVFAGKFNFDNSNFLKTIRKHFKNKKVTTDISYNEKSWNKDFQDLDNLYFRTEESIKKADIVIIENTSNQSGLGFLAGRAIGLGKTVFILIQENHHEHKENSNLIKAYSRHTKNINKFYNSKNLTLILDEIIEEYIKLGDTKFMLRLSPDLLGYLNSQSQELGQSKAEIIRNLLEKERQKS